MEQQLQRSLRSRLGKPIERQGQNPMHAALFVCLPVSQAHSSLQARKKVCDYLTEEGFDTELRFSGRCDYFSVGGRWSGRLRLLALRHDQPKIFDRFWTRYEALLTAAERECLFRKTFPAYRDTPPIGRVRLGFLGRLDDAQIMNESLFRQLKPGFSEEVTYAYEISEPNVIFTDDPDDNFAWPKTREEAAQFWVVIIDYHS